MEYSIRELANLSGVTPRTLRWYDQIGLLKPSRITESGYRFYGPAEVNRLQDILLYRALGVELAKIKTCLDDPSYDRLAVLRNHLSALTQEQLRLERLIQSVTDTIHAEERKEIMDDKKKFAAIKKQAIEQNESSYGAEIRAKYGNEQVDAANAAMMGLSQEQYEQWQDLGNELQRRLEEAVAAGLLPESAAGREIAQLHRQWLSTPLPDYTPAKHRGIAQMYVLDERFTAYYDKNIPGCAQFLRDAVDFWIH